MGPRSDWHYELRLLREITVNAGLSQADTRPRVWRLPRPDSEAN